MTISCKKSINLFTQKSFTNIGRFPLTYVTKLLANYVLLQKSDTNFQNLHFL